MQKNTSVTLGSHYEQFISKQVKSGRYASASEAVRAGLRLLEEHEARLEALRQALIEGEESGISDKTVADIMKDADERLQKDGKLPTH